MEKVKAYMDYVRSNVNPEIVISTIAASFILGGIVYAANRSGVKVIKQVAAVAK